MASLYTTPKIEKPVPIAHASTAKRARQLKKARDEAAIKQNKLLRKKLEEEEGKKEFVERWITFFPHMSKVTARRQAELLWETFSRANHTHPPQDHFLLIGGRER